MIAQYLSLQAVDLNPVFDGSSCILEKTHCLRRSFCYFQRYFTALLAVSVDRLSAKMVQSVSAAVKVLNFHPPEPAKQIIA
jgi:uncharacterized protein (UPF0254 family)